MLNTTVAGATLFRLFTEAGPRPTRRHAESLRLRRLPAS